jgi:hypothetical protein
MDLYHETMKGNRKFLDDPENQNLALITAVSYSLDPQDINKNHGCFAMDP